jgi:hypothetical protein
VFFLQTNGSGVLSFAGVSASAGQVIQVVQATDSTERSTSSSSFVTASTTLSTSITPSSASNKILVLASIVLKQETSAQNNLWTVTRGGTNLDGSNYGFGRANVFGSGSITRQSVSFLDSPSSTSSLTYDVRIRNDDGGSVSININSATGTLILMEIKG